MRSLPQILADCQAVLEEGQLSSQLSPPLVMRFAALCGEGLATAHAALDAIDPTLATGAQETADQALATAERADAAAKGAAVRLAQLADDIADAQARCDALRDQLAGLKESAPPAPTPAPAPSGA